MPALYENPPHLVDIYMPAAPTVDSGGGVKLNWPTDPSFEDVPCSINTTGSGRRMRNAQDTITVGNRVGFWSAKLEELGITLCQGMKMVASDTGRTFIIQGLESPNRPYGHELISIPALTYVTCDEIL